MISTKKILALRRAVQFLSPWTRAGVEVLNEDLEIVLTARDEATAGLIVETHNTWLPLANGWFLVHRALKDRRTLNELFASEAGL